MSADTTTLQVSADSTTVVAEADITLISYGTALTISGGAVDSLDGSGAINIDLTNPAVPVVSITPASTGGAGSMSATDKVLLGTAEQQPNKNTPSGYLGLDLTGGQTGYRSANPRHASIPMKRFARAWAAAGTAVAEIAWPGDSIGGGGLASDSQKTSMAALFERTMMAFCPASTRDYARGWWPVDVPAASPYAEGPHWLYRSHGSANANLGWTLNPGDWIADTQACDGIVLEYTAKQTAGATLNFYYRASTNGSPAPDGTTSGWTLLESFSTTDGTLGAGKVSAGRRKSYAFNSGVYGTYDFMVICTGSGTVDVDGDYPTQGNRTTGFRLTNWSIGGRGFGDMLGVGVVPGATGGTSTFDNLPAASGADSVQLQRIANNLPPGIMLVLGGNDYITHHNVANPATPTQFGNLLTRALAAIRYPYDQASVERPTIVYGFEPELLGNVPSFPGLPTNWHTDYLEVARSVCEADGNVVLLNLYEALGSTAAGDNYTAYDGLHPNDAGHAAMARPCVEAWLPTPTQPVVPLGITAALADFVPLTLASSSQLTTDATTGSKTLKISYPSGEAIFLLDASILPGVPIGSAIGVGVATGGGPNVALFYDSVNHVGKLIFGGGTDTLAPFIEYVDDTHLSLGSVLLRCTTNPVSGDDLVRKGFLGSFATLATGGTGTWVRGDATTQTMAALSNALGLTSFATMATGGTGTWVRGDATTQTSAALAAAIVGSLSGIAWSQLATGGTLGIDATSGARFVGVDIFGAGCIQIFINGTDAQPGMGWIGTSPDVWLSGPGGSTPATNVHFWSKATLDELTQAAGDYSLNSHGITHSRAPTGAGELVRYEGVPRRLLSVVSTVGNASGTGLTDLENFSIPAGTLVSSGDVIDWWACGKFASNTNSKRLLVRLAGNNIWDTGSTTNSSGAASTDGWVLKVQIERLTSTTVRYGIVAANAKNGNAAFSAAIFTQVFTVSDLGSNALTVDIQGGSSVTGAASDVTLEAETVTYVPANF